MKLIAQVTNVDDPKSLMRIMVKLLGYDGESPWCYPCSPFAGPNYGFAFLPVVGDQVYVEKDQHGRWLWVGYRWLEDQKPIDATPTSRIIRTPVGHQIKLVENGDVEIEHSNGNTITLTQSGDLIINVSGEVNINVDGKATIDASQIELNGSMGDVVTTKHICAFTSGPHVLGSTTVKAGG